MEPIYVLLAVLLVPLIWFIATYNKLVRLRNHCTEAWSNIDTELKRRYNLIPNLVDTVKGHAAHEKTTLEEVTRLRRQCMDDHGSPKHQANSENQLIGALNKLLAVVENYPGLKASKNFLGLQDELATTENRIQAARRFYNGNIRENNNAVETFPSLFVARAFKFPLREFFEIESAAVRAVPNVQV